MERRCLRTARNFKVRTISHCAFQLEEARWKSVQTSAKCWSHAGKTLNVRDSYDCEKAIPGQIRTATMHITGGKSCQIAQACTR